MCVVRGHNEVLVIDTGSSPAEAAAIEADLRQLGSIAVVGAVNTHAHFDHSFGNQHFGPGSALDVPIYGHHRMPAHLCEYETPRLENWRRGTGDEPVRDWAEIVITGPSRLVATRETIAVGGRAVELWPLGPGHTDTDLVVHVPDANTWIVGDVVEESGPPMYGSGCFPLHLARRRDAAPRRDRRLRCRRSGPWSAGQSIDEGLADGDRWPFPTDGLRLALVRSYEQLGETIAP